MEIWSSPVRCNAEKKSQICIYNSICTCSLAIYTISCKLSKSYLARPVYTGLISRVNYELVHHTLLQLSNFSSSSQTSPASYNANLQYPSVLRFITQIVQLNSHYKILAEFTLQLLTCYFFDTMLFF